MTEQTLQKAIITYIESIGGYAVVTVKMSKAGIPDILACINGTFFGFEVKLPGRQNTLKPLQQHNIDLIIKSGGKAHMVTSVEEVKSILSLYGFIQKIEDQI